MRFKTIISLLICTINVLASLGIENRPKMRRACLNRLDSTLNILWFKPVDNCNSFISFNLYGRDDILNTFQLLASYPSYSIDNISLKLKNQKNWEFFVVYNKACNGTDSVYSDTITIDNTPPVDSELDSVSVDFATQKTIIGWSSNSSKDIKGYNVYYITGTNALIANTSNTFHLDNSSRDPSAAAIQYGIAAFDSCNNTARISPPHTTIHLSNTFDQCSQKITLNWERYRGWPKVGAGEPEKKYEIFLKINTGNFNLIATISDPNISSFTYNFPAFGNLYCFYVRATKADLPISSSSNIVCINSSSIIPSRFSYIAKASVQNNKVEITLMTQTGTSLNKINLYKSEGNSSFSLWQTINTSGGKIELIDGSANVHTKSYQYYFTTEGPCNLIFDTSQMAKTILLNVSMLGPNNQDVRWTLYDNFIKLTSNQQLLLSDNDAFNRSSPWNIITSFNNISTQTTDTSSIGVNQQKICYCIRALENTANTTYNRQDTSYSNIECVTADPLVYFPNAIQINGYNTVFYPKGVYIDYTKSYFVIYNRWGQIVYETNDIAKGWDGTSNKSIVESDVYVYKAIIVGLNGKTLFFNGTISLLK